MIETPRPLAPELWATLPAPDPAALLEQLVILRLENAALRAENAVLQARVRELEVRLRQNSSNSSRPPSSDPPQLPSKRGLAPRSLTAPGHASGWTSGVVPSRSLWKAAGDAPAAQ
jgi:transposase